MGPRLERLGIDQSVRAALEAVPDGLLPGRVVRVEKGYSFVDTEEGDLLAEPAASILKSRDPMSVPAVGDWVLVRHDEGMDAALIERVLPRRSAIVRRDPRSEDAPQVLAANVDLAFLVHSMATRLKPGRLERELVSVFGGGATPVVVLNKVDLVEDPTSSILAVEEVAPNVEVLVTSALLGTGMDELETRLRPGKTGVLIGPSGAGKSTIVNRLAGEEIRAVGSVREKDHKGRHTTVSRELVLSPSGGLLIDTPGLRAFAPWPHPEGLASVFPDIEELSAACRFRDCLHLAEPGCAVLAAVERGDLDGARLERYRALKEELEGTARKR